MGLGVSKTMDANVRKQQEFMMEMQRTQVERQIQMQNQMRERQMAFQVARSRELLYWFASFYALAAAGMVLRYRQTRNKTILAPLPPLTFMLGYQTDLAYGNKLMRIRAEAESIMDFEKNLVELPYGVPTLSTIDQARTKRTDDKRLLKVHDIYF